MVSLNIVRVSSYVQSVYDILPLFSMEFNDLVTDVDPIDIVVAAAVLVVLAQISPDQCTTQDSTNTLGTCLTRNECTNGGGTASGTCAGGLGVCCIGTCTTDGFL